MFLMLPSASWTAPAAGCCLPPRIVIVHEGDEQTEVTKQEQTDNIRNDEPVWTEPEKKRHNMGQTLCDAGHSQRRRLWDEVWEDGAT